MEIKKLDFKQKYFLYCRDCKFTQEIFAQVNNKSYISRIKITEKI